MLASRNGTDFTEINMVNVWCERKRETEREKERIWNVKMLKNDEKPVTYTALAKCVCTYDLKKHFGKKRTCFHLEIKRMNKQNKYIYTHNDFSIYIYFEKSYRVTSTR